MKPPPSQPNGQSDFSGWLDGSLKRPVFIDRSEGEKLASEKLLREQAKSEALRRWTYKVVFGVSIGLPCLIAGIFLGIWLSWNFL